MTAEEIRLGVERLKPWYHSIELGHGIRTPGKFENESWARTREARGHLDYKGKQVLDIASFDGMWAFEAEELGAALVIATDCNYRALPNFMFAHQVRASKVVPFLNVPVHELTHRLDTYLQGHAVRWTPEDQRPVQVSPRFDIAQHTGLFYHLRDPLQSLLQCRSLLKEGGHLLLETACWMESDLPVMLYNKHSEGFTVYNDQTTWWCPTLPCLLSVLKESLFEALPQTIRKTDGRIARVSLVARATPAEAAAPELLRELRNTYRTPGLEL